MKPLKFSEWEALIKDRISRELEERVIVEASRETRDRLDRTAIQEILSALFPDLEKLLTDAISIHISLYNQFANAEAGFNLGLEPKHFLIGEPGGYAVVFATINSCVCARLLEFEGTRQLWTQLTLERSERNELMGITSTEFREDEAIMDLLVSALPHTTETIGMSTPSEIIERAFEQRLGQFEVLAALRRRARDSSTLLANNTSRDRPKRSRKPAASMRLTGVQKDMGQVAKVCQDVLDNPSLVPQRIVQAATRLMHSFGDRDFASIEHRDFDRYLEVATLGPRADAWMFDGAAEIACYDIYMFGMFAFWNGHDAFYERVKDWLCSYMELIGRVPS